MSELQDRDLGLWSTCSSWLLALGGSRNRVEAGRIPKRPPKPIFLFVWRSGRSFLKLFRPEGAPVRCARITTGGREEKQGDRAGRRASLEIRRRL